MTPQEVYEFLMSPDRKAKQLSSVEAIAEIKGLNNYQLKTLHRFYDIGLRGDHLRNMQLLKLPYSIHEIVQIPRLAIEVRRREFCLADYEVILFLTDEARKERKLAPQAALEEISELNLEQLVLLRKNYGFGLRGKMLLSRQWQDHPAFLETILFLIDKKRGSNKMSFADAFNKLALFSPYDHNSLELIRIHFDNGLRPIHLQSLKPNSPDYPSRCISDADRGAIEFLTSYNRKKSKLSPALAVKEIDELFDDRLGLLLKLYDSGLRGEHLRITGWSAWDIIKIRALMILMTPYPGVQALSFEQALPEINSLDNFRLMLFGQYHSEGLKVEHLQDECLKKLEGEYHPAVLDIIKFLTANARNERKLTPSEAIIEISGIHPSYYWLFETFYDAGVRGKEMIGVRYIEDFQRELILFMMQKIRGKAQLTFSQAYIEAHTLDRNMVISLLKYYDCGLRAEHLKAIRLTSPELLEAMTPKVAEALVKLTSKKRNIKSPSALAAENTIKGLSQCQLLLLNNVYDKFHDMHWVAKPRLMNAIIFLACEDRDKQQVHFTQAMCAMNPLNITQLEQLILDAELHEKYTWQFDVKLHQRSPLVNLSILAVANIERPKESSYSPNTFPQC